MATQAIARPKSDRIPFSERAFGIAVLLYASTGFIRLLMSSEEFRGMADESLDSPVKRILWPIAYLGCAYLLSKRRKQGWNALVKMPLLLLLIVFIATSVFWSESRTISALSVGALVGNTIIGFYFGVRYSIKEFLRLLAWVFGIIAVGTLISPFVIGQDAIYAGYWYGFFAGKNSLGQSMLIGFLVFYALQGRDFRAKYLYRTMTAVCALLVFLSGSGTSILILLMLSFAIFWRSFLSRRVGTISTQVKILLVVVLFSILGLGYYWDDILDALGKNPDLTGRVSLWGMLLLMVREKPLFGYGYGGFWIFGGPVQAVWDALKIDPGDASYAHDGYLQILLDCGFVGLGMLFAFLYVSVRDAWNYVKVTSDFWPLLFLGFILLNNLTEATLAARNNMSWALLVALSVQLVRALPPHEAEVRGARSSFTSPSEISSAPA
jgi:O-antigen ligase